MKALLNENIGRMSTRQVAGGDLATARRGVWRDRDGEIESLGRLSGGAAEAT
jgi:hypothetical protein